MENKPPTPPQSESGANHGNDKSPRPNGSVEQRDERGGAREQTASPEVKDVPVEASERQEEQASGPSKKRTRTGEYSHVRHLPSPD